MSRKEPSFGQLVEYMSDIDKSDMQYNIHHNIYSQHTADIEEEFVQNARYMPRRKNGNYMYHEILSITKSSTLDDVTQKQMLRDIAQQYAQKRAKNNLVFGTLHDDHDHHLHYHILISANALGSSRRTRLSKSMFSHCKKEMERLVLAQYPELEQEVVMGKTAEEKLSRKGSEQKRRTGATPQRDTLKAKLHDIFQQSHTKQQFFDALNKEDLAFYVRGKTIGVTDLAHQRNHRLKTLGLLDEFHAVSDRIQLNTSEPNDQEKNTQQQRQEEIDNIRNKHQQGNDSQPKNTR